MISDQLINRKFGYKKIIYVNMPNLFKSSHCMQHDLWRMTASFQGLFNRELEKHKVILYLYFTPDDQFWLDYMMKPEKMLHGYDVLPVNSLDEFLELFHFCFEDMGFILWDPQVPATANLCATICGITGQIPLKYDLREDSLYSLIQSCGFHCDSKLVGKFTGKGIIPDTDIVSSGSAKCDAYLWALEFLIDKTIPDIFAYMPDGASCVEGNPIYEKSEGKVGEFSCLPNHDYLISRNVFFWDLTPVDDEVPCDDPLQPLGADAQTFHKVSRRIYERNGGKVTYDVGFPPWWLKYTAFSGFSKHRINTVETYFNDCFSTYNFVMECDAAQPCWMTNASVYYKYPKRTDYPNNKPKFIPPYDTKTVYLLMYMGDYDSSAWLKQKVIPLFNDERRNGCPIMWNFDGNLIARSGPFFDFIYENATADDYFASGNSGCGNINPSLLFKGNGNRTLPDGGEAWYEFCKQYYDMFNHDITGFLINGWSPIDERVMEIYQKLSPVGVLHNDLFFSPPLMMYKGTPFVHLMNGEGLEPTLPLWERSNNATTFLFSSRLGHGQNFCAYRLVGYTRAQLYEFQDAIIDRLIEIDSSRTYKFVDPYTFFEMIKQSGQGLIVKE